MNLWVRLIWMLLTARLRGAVQIFDTSVIRLRVLPNDLRQQRPLLHTGRPR
jgi:hypothetical protein